MSVRHTSSAFARVDPAHVFDGLFVPCSGAARPALALEPRRFGNAEISFEGSQQLGADDQSILLAITAQLGIDGLFIDDDSGQIARQLRLDLDIQQQGASSSTLPLTRQTTLRSLLHDAGYKDRDSGASFRRLKTCLHRLRVTTVREVDHSTGWDRASRLISTAFNHVTGEVFVAANPRLSSAIFHGQHVRVSLQERRRLESSVAKILHCWFSSNIRLGKSLGNGNGARIDTLAPHVWGTQWENYSAKQRSTRRGYLRAALDEIRDRTAPLHAAGYGWIIDYTAKGLVSVARPAELPVMEELFAPGELIKLLDGLPPAKVGTTPG